MLVKIVKNNKTWNWEAYDSCNIPIYGKGFNSKRKAKKDWKKFAKSVNVKKWKYNNVWRKLWKTITR